MNEDKLAPLSPAFRERLHCLLDECNEIMGVEWRITLIKQNYLLNERSCGKPTAVDIVPIRANGEPWWTAPPWVWQTMGMLAEGLDLFWAGRIPKLRDHTHIELRLWKE